MNLVPVNHSHPCSTQACCLNASQLIPSDQDQQPATPTENAHSVISTRNEFSHPSCVGTRIDEVSNNDEDGFTTVNRGPNKNKKAKVTVLPPLQAVSSSSSDSASSVSSGKSTSSTNTSSITHNNTGINSKHRSNGVQEGNPNKNVVSVQSEITDQAHRYAETRYAFPPFIAKFQQNMVDHSMINEISDFFQTKFKVKLEIAGHRIKDKKELLLFVGNRESFVLLYENNNWPPKIKSAPFTLIRPTHLPPQFSVVVRNVPIDYDIVTLLNEMKEEYPNAVNAFRMTNKNQQPTSFIRVDIQSTKDIDNLLKCRYVYLDNTRYSVTEYLAPAKVLVCSKCYQIGHFRSTCKSPMEHCRVCGLGVVDVKKHKMVCNNQQCCIRCKGQHDSNDVRCPDIKSYRGTLTKSLLPTTNLQVGVQQQQMMTQRVTNNVFRNNERDFPVLNVNGNRGLGSYGTSMGQQSFMSKRIDELTSNVRRLDENLNRLMDLNNSYCSQLSNIQNLILKQDHQLQLLHLDSTFCSGLVSQFISPICQVMVEILPTLIQKNILNDKTLLCPSVTFLCQKLMTELPNWTTTFDHNENLKRKMINDFKQFNPSAPGGESNMDTPGGSVN